MDNNGKIKVIKQSIANCFQNQHSIVSHTYFFIKSYYLYLQSIKKNIDLIDSDFVRTVMKVVSFRIDKRGSGKFSDKNKLYFSKFTSFYNAFYKPNNNWPIVSDDKISQVLNFEADQIVTSINTNISTHYVKHIEKFIKISLNYYSLCDIINKSKVFTPAEKKSKLFSLREDFRNIKKDILSIDIKYTLTSSSNYHKWINKYKWKIIPKKDNYEKSIEYDVHVSPQSYLNNLFYINSELEKLSLTNDKIKLFNILPLRTHLIPSYIKLDSQIIISLLIGENHKEYQPIGKNYDKIWNTVCYTGNQWFKKKIINLII